MTFSRSSEPSQKMKNFDFWHWKKSSLNTSQILIFTLKFDWNRKILIFWLIKIFFDLHWGWKINQILNEKSEIFILTKTSQNDKKTCAGARIWHILTFLEKQKFWLFSFKSKMFWLFENLKKFSLLHWNLSFDFFN